MSLPFHVLAGACPCCCLSLLLPVPAVACSCCCLSLPLHVLAVILSAAKDPEELNAPKPSVPFNPYPSPSLPLPVLSNHKNRHFDRSCSRICEQRSEDIRFFTQSHDSSPRKSISVCKLCGEW
jgi:hypothetical protein